MDSNWLSAYCCPILISYYQRQIEQERERDGGGGVMKYPKLIPYFPACPQVDGASATTGVNWEALFHTIMLKMRQQAQNAKTHVIKSRLNDSCGSPGD